MIQSTIGKKIVVALTGVVLYGFLIGHVAGNLLVFGGPAVYNHYAEAIKANPLLLWGTRSVLLLSIFLHIIYTVQLTIRNRSSRPVSYSEYNPRQANFPSRVMIWSGLLVAVFIVYHLLHFTFGIVHPDFLADVYQNVITGFQVTWVAVFYIVAMLALSFHLFHGIWSVFQTLGLNHPKYNAARKIFAALVTLVIIGGFISIPVAVMTGCLR